MTSLWCASHRQRTLLSTSSPPLASGTIWSGTVAATDSDAYAAYLHRTGLKDFRATPGNLGAFAFRRTEGDRVVFTTLSIWDGMDGIRRFAGDDVERARFYEEDDRFLIDRDWTVTHTEVVFVEMAGG